MNEGVYRILSALSDGRTHARSAVVRDAGEAQSVLLALEKDKPRWFDAHGAELRLSEKGRKAHAFEQRARTPALSEAELVDALRARLDGRPAVKRELDQVFATPETVARRARRLVATGEAQRGVLFLGDDDLTSLALRLLLEAAGLEDRRVRVLELDEELVAPLARVARDQHELLGPLLVLGADHVAGRLEQLVREAGRPRGSERASRCASRAMISRVRYVAQRASLALATALTTLFQYLFSTRFFARSSRLF